MKRGLLLFSTTLLFAISISTISSPPSCVHAQKDDRMDIPKYQPKDEDDEMMHGGQDAFCTREGTAESRYFKPNCHCEKMCDRGKLIEDHAKCRVSCRKESCKCEHKCTT